MKKKIVMAGSAVAAVAVLGLGLYHSDASQADTLSSEEVKQMLKDQYPGTVTEMELEKTSTKAIYEVEIEGEGKSYELTLNAETGEVTHLEEKTVFTDQKEKAESDNNLVVKEKDDQKTNTDDKKTDKKEAKDDNNDQSDHKSSTKEKTEKKDASKTENNKKDEGTIGTGEASRIALKEFAGTVTSIELDEDDGRLIYEIEIEAKNGEAEVEIDAYTGKTIVLEIDRDNGKDYEYDEDDDRDDDQNDD